MPLHSRKIYRTRLARSLMSSSFKTAFPCSSCVSQKCDCLLSPKHDPCLSCLATGAKCSTVVYESDWSRANATVDKLQSELDRVEDEEEHLDSRRSELAAKRSRLQKQLKQAHLKKAKLLYTAQISVEEDDRMNQELGLSGPSASGAVVEPVGDSSDPAGPASPSAFSLSGFSQSWLEGVDFAGAISSPPPGPSSNA